MLELSRIYFLQLDTKDNRPHVPKLTGQTNTVHLFVSEIRWLQVCSNAGTIQDRSGRNIISCDPSERTFQTAASPLLPCCLPSDCREPAYRLFQQKKKKKKLRKYNVNKIRYPSLLGILETGSMELANCHNSKKESTSKSCEHMERWLLVESIGLGHPVLPWLRGGDLRDSCTILAFAWKECSFG